MQKNRGRIISKVYLTSQYSNLLAIQLNYLKLCNMINQCYRPVTLKKKKKKVIKQQPVNQITVGYLCILSLSCPQMSTKKHKNHNILLIFIVYVPQSLQSISATKQAAMQSKSHFSDEDTSLEWIMKRGIRTILEVPTKDQIYDNVSFKLGAFYKRFWENKYEGLKQNTRKSGEIIALAENMQEISREDDRLIKVCAYAREVKKFQAERYEQWKRYIWADFNGEEKALMEQYVENLTPPVPLPGESKAAYESRQKQKMILAYKSMKRGMLLVEVFEKIWTIRMYKKDNKNADVDRHQKLAKEMLARIKSCHPNFRGYLSNKMGLEDWQEIEQLW